MKRALGMLAYVLITLAVLYVAAAALLYTQQTRLLFITEGPFYETPGDVGWPFEDVTLTVGEHETHGWFIPAAEASRGVILFSHGNAGNIGGRMPSTSILRDLGFDVLLYDYGGYGKSTGAPSETRCYEDIRAMYRYLTEQRHIAPERIVLFGRSLGAGVTCQLATEVDVAAVILESPFRSVPAMAKRLYPIFPFGWLIRHRFDNESKVAKLRTPVLIVHSPDDEIIPFDHGQRVFELASEPKQFLQIRGGHNDGFWQTGQDYADGIDAFLRRHVAESRPE